jgi:hypothetical protein
MAFKKAAPEQARLKISMYGPPGSGKTFTALLMAEGLAANRGKRIAYVDTERGTDFYALPVPSRRVHPDAFDFDAVYTRSISEVLDEVTHLDPDVHGVVIIDSISHLWDAAMDAYGGNRNSIGAIPMHAWSSIKRPYKRLIDFLIGSKFDVFILGRQKSVFDGDDKTGVAMRAEGETAYEPHICLRMENQVNKADKTQTTSRIVAYPEKDRTGVLQGKVIVGPSFSTIEPLLPLLGDIQAQPEDAEERAAKDAEALEADASGKSAAKEAKSLELYRANVEKLSSIQNLAGFNDFLVQAKKDRRYLLEDHQKALRELIDGVKQRLVDKELSSK